MLIIMFIGLLIVILYWVFMNKKTHYNSPQLNILLDLLNEKVKTDTRFKCIIPNKKYHIEF
jgi:hypothetical protein